MNECKLKGHSLKSLHDQFLIDYPNILISANLNYHPYRHQQFVSIKYFGLPAILPIHAILAFVWIINYPSYSRVYTVHASSLNSGLIKNWANVWIRPSFMPEIYRIPDTERFLQSSICRTMFCIIKVAPKLCQSSPLGWGTFFKRNNSSLCLYFGVVIAKRKYFFSYIFLKIN